jgi:tRNA (guanine37-N1)-methyltransferase
VPEVLLSGNHGAIDLWRRQQSIKRTFERRPDLLQNVDLSSEDKTYSEAVEKRAVMVYFLCDIMTECKKEV